MVLMSPSCPSLQACEKDSEIFHLHHAVPGRSSGASLGEGRTCRRRSSVRRRFRACCHNVFSRGVLFLVCSSVLECLVGTSRPELRRAGSCQLAGAQRSLSFYETTLGTGFWFLETLCASGVYSAGVVVCVASYCRQGKSVIRSIDCRTDSARRA